MCECVVVLCSSLHGICKNQPRTSSTVRPPSNFFFPLPAYRAL